jgi:hypothetical protein
MTSADVVFLFLSLSKFGWQGRALVILLPSCYYIAIKIFLRANFGRPMPSKRSRKFAETLTGETGRMWLKAIRGLRPEAKLSLPLNLLKILTQEN